MKIKSVRIENFRSFKDEIILFSDYTCLVGPNGAGKSTVLCALNVFFRETQHSPIDLTCLSVEDFHGKDTANPIRVTVTFDGLSEDAQGDFADYCRQGELVVTAEATFDETSQEARVVQFGQRKGMAEFKPYFKADSDGASAADLKEIYAKLREAHEGLPSASTKGAMTDALRAYEDAHPDDCVLIPSSDQFYGFSKGANRLAKHIQWIFVPAVKDATDEHSEAKDTALGKLLARTVRSKVNFSEQVQKLRADAQEAYQGLLAANQLALDGISDSLKGRLGDWAHPDASLRLEWRQDPSRSVKVEEPLAEIVAGEGAFEGQLARFGHGLQRCYLLTVLQELAGCDDEAGPRLILACEEPELFQHPPQAQHLAGVLERLSQGNAQVMVCTHSPYFVSGRGFEDVRMIRKDRATSRARVSQVTYEQLGASIAAATGDPVPPRRLGVIAQIHQALQPSLSEIFFAPFVVLVEGLEDVAYVTAYLHLSDRWEEWRRLGCHIVPVNGKGHMIRPLAIAREMGIPSFAVFDADGHETDQAKRTKHERDNRAILRLSGVAVPDPFPADIYWGDGIVQWDKDLGTSVAADFEAEDWQRYKEAARMRNGQVGGLDKNSLFIADLLEIAWQDGARSASLDRLCEEIVTKAKGSKISTAELASAA